MQVFDAYLNEDRTKISKEDFKHVALYIHVRNLQYGVCS